MSQESEVPVLSEVPLALVLVVFSLGALTQAYGISGFRSVSGPGVVPMVASGVMVLSSLVLLLKGMVVTGSGSSGPERLRGFMQRALPVRVVVMVTMMVAYLYLMTRLGFMLSSGLFLFVSLLFLWQRGVLRAAAVTGLALALIWLIFRTVFQVVLPQGSWLTGVF